MRGETFAAIRTPAPSSAESSSSSPTSVMKMTTANANDVGSKSSSNNNNYNNNPRSCILQVGVYAGRLCELANTHPAMISDLPASGRMAATNAGNVVSKGDSSSYTIHSLSSTDHHLVTTMADLLVSLWLTSRVLKLNMIVAIHNKLKLNAEKYPVEHCKGKAGKYTQYSHLTGITKTNQVTEVAKQEEDVGSNNDAGQSSATLQQSNVTPAWRSVISLAQVSQELPQLSDTIASFAEDRLWTRYHTPRNLVIALMGEYGELAELLQFKGDGQEDYNNQQQPNDEPFDLVLSLERTELDKLSQELADVSIYLLRLATVLDVVKPLCEALDGMATDV